MPSGRLAEAEAAVELSSSDPRAALAIATRLLLGGSGTSGTGADTPRPGAETRAVAGRAAALAELELGLFAEARRRYEEAIEEAVADGGVPTRLAELRIGLAAVLLQSEDPEAALEVVDEALAVTADRRARGRAEAQRALVLMRLGRHDEALAQADSALDTCRAEAMMRPVARLLSNRGVLLAYLGDYEKADESLREALGLLRGERSELGAARALHNLGFVMARRGEIADALRTFDATLAEYERLGVPLEPLLVDRCEVLLAARLLPEARDAAAAAVAGYERAGRAADLAESRLRLAEAELALGNRDQARRGATRAMVAFARQGRRSWELLARLVILRASWASQHDLAAQVGAAAALAGDLRQAGLRLQALDAAVLGSTEAIRNGMADLCVPLLAEADPAGAAAQGSSAEERIQGWYGVALERLAARDDVGSLRALGAGIQVAEEHRATLGATELRARSGSRSAELAELGMAVSVGTGSPFELLRWSEVARARSLTLPSVRPAENPVMADLLTQLRHTVASTEERVRAGDAEGGELSRLDQRRRQLEMEVRQLSMAMPNAAGTQSPTMPEPDELQEMLATANASLIVLAGIRGELQAIVVTPTNAVVRPIGPRRTIERWHAGLRMALGRLVLGGGATETAGTAAELLARSAKEADRFLFEAIRGDLLAGSTAGIAIVPTGSLHAMPWGLLPTLRGRPVAIAPSVAFAVGGTARPGTPSPLLVAGPDVFCAGDEVGAISELYATPTVLGGRDATVAGVMAGLDGAGVAHIAAHGRFRGDNPLFSSLQLADGPLTVFDLETLRRPPDLVILSACDSGRSEVQPGDELMGTAAAMLGLGARSIVAAVAPVPDGAAVEVMFCLHRHLRDTGSAPQALARAQADVGAAMSEPGILATRGDEAMKALAAATFVCLGGI